MDVSTFIHPAVIVPLASGLIVFIIWLVRLEGKGNSTNDALVKFKEEMRAEIKEIEADVKDTRTRFFEHAANMNYHHNEAAQTEYKTAMERRFLGVENSLKDIGIKLDRLADQK